MHSGTLRQSRAFLLRGALDRNPTVVLASAMTNRQDANRVEDLHARRDVPSSAGTSTHAIRHCHLCDDVCRDGISLSDRRYKCEVLVAGHPALVLGIDTMAAFETPAELPVVITHELFHRYNFQAAGFSDDPGNRQAIWRTLWPGGPATYVSCQLNPQVSLGDVLISKDLARRGPKLIRRPAAALRGNGAPHPSLYAEYFEGGSARARRAGIPQLSG